MVLLYVEDPRPALNDSLQEVDCNLACKLELYLFSLICCSRITDTDNHFYKTLTCATDLNYQNYRGKTVDSSIAP